VCFSGLLTLTFGCVKSSPRLFEGSSCPVWVPSFRAAFPARWSARGRFSPFSESSNPFPYSSPLFPCSFECYPFRDPTDPYCSTMLASSFSPFVPGAFCSVLLLFYRPCPDGGPFLRLVHAVGGPKLKLFVFCSPSLVFFYRVVGFSFMGALMLRVFLRLGVIPHIVTAFYVSSL